MHKFPEREGRGNLPVTVYQADGCPHQLNENKEKKDKNSQIQPWCLDNHNIKLLQHRECYEEFPAGQGALEKSE